MRKLSVTRTRWALAVVASLTILALAAVADEPPKAPENYKEGFEKGGLFFDDGVGVVHIRQSHSTAETDYAPLTRSRQEQIEADLRAAWSNDPVVLTDGKGTPELQGKTGRIN